ncbi:MAG: ABC transporter permease subunit [Oscillospiraceae bacterium]|jgi:ABC-2 type transport system permease protein|nr:ABC transporter permease subunit [Oscillospiraceae bacterium]
MNLLLKANFSRLWKDGAFWASLAVMAGVGLFEVAVGVSARRQGISVPLENRYFVLALMPGIVLSAFCSLFVGGEYSGGTIRNKITVGHTRDAVYLASLCTCIAAGGLACLAYIVPMVVLGIPLLGIFQMELGAVVWFTLCVFVMTGSLCAVFTLIAILNQNRAVTAIICITLAYFLLFLGIYLNSRLTELEIIPAREYIENGQILLREAEKNPAYVSGLKRTVYQALYCLPGCQAVQLVAEAENCPWSLPLISALCAIGSTAAGLALFRRKDLK